MQLIVSVADDASAVTASVKTVLSPAPAVITGGGMMPCGSQPSRNARLAQSCTVESVWASSANAGGRVGAARHANLDRARCAASHDGVVVNAQRASRHRSFAEWSAPQQSEQCGENDEANAQPADAFRSPLGAKKRGILIQLERH